VRRFIVASLDSFASRIVTDLRDSMPPPTLEFPPAPPRAWRPTRPWVAGIAAAGLAALAFAAAWFVDRDELSKPAPRSRD